MSSPAGDTSAAGPESRIRHLQDLILSGEDGFTCGAVIPKDILDPSKMMLYFSNAQLESHAMTFPPTATSLDAFMRLASPSPFGRNAETVLDAEYRNAREFKPPNFAMSSDIMNIGGILESIATQLGLDHPIGATISKVNAYPTGGFFKAHRDTPLGDNHFGTITICLPVPFTGGELVVKQDGSISTFKWESASAAHDGLVQWAFLYSDCEHEVLPVTSGTRVTIAYDVWWTRLPSVQVDSSKFGVDRSPIYRYLESLLADKARFMPDGGKIGFGLRHAYAVDDTADVPRRLKGVDRTVQLAVLSLGLRYKVLAAYDLKERVRMSRARYSYYIRPETTNEESQYYDYDDWYHHFHDGSDGDSEDLVDDETDPINLHLHQARLSSVEPAEDVVCFANVGSRFDMFCGKRMKYEGGISLEDDVSIDQHMSREYTRHGKNVVWVTETDKFRNQSVYMAYGNDSPHLGTLYAGACLIVTIPPAGHRA